ncbi:MAG: hypothetical protein EOS11_11590 [Mesorhizobium sp.]|nr:MAG: hypothetical protein EOR98_18745 [Mesorhizobium sp.]RWN61978.1 MAG: hypothetical protein EOS00_10775 [Mesorhizobium sp.]RWN73512.1 MAG: hypothetical protein EOS02_24020 [Mesorhizobium sp.]RWN73918.1 MAG: hypothetical protein EOS01_25290 [Mesorhizobium sp.]RWN86514.1 MAG: hypothetical protein EOS04_18535 [Mesorhizobium sp.]
MDASPRQNAAAGPLIDRSPAANDHDNMTVRAEGSPLDAIEKAIRNAFEKGNAEDRAFRERVYRSAFAALDRALQANPNVTVEVAIKRRKAVQAKITEIESEFLPAVPAVGRPTDDDAAAPAVEQPAGSEADADAEPEADAEPDAGADAEPAPPPEVIVDGPAESPASVAPPVSDAPPASDAPRSRVLPIVPDIMPEAAFPDAPEIDLSSPQSAGDGDAEVMPDRDDRRVRGPRLPLTAIFLGVTLLAAAGIGLYFAAQTGVFKSAAELDTAPPQTPPTVEDDDFTPPGDTAPPLNSGEANEARDWINVFSPSDPTLVSAPSDAKAEVMQDDSGSFLRIRSGASGSAISFDVEQGVLDKLAGKHATFDIVARSEEGQETQISVDCNFGELGDCGRKRYAVGHERNEYLFDVRFPDKRPGAAGTIAINSDFDKQGKSVDIYEIRVAIVP